MKLIRFGPAGKQRPGVLVPGDAELAYDVSGYIADYNADFWSSSGPERLHEALTPGLPVLDVHAMRLGPPISRPTKIVCIGLNYRDHATESGMDVPVEPVVFTKAPNTIVGPDDNVMIPPHSTKTDWEVELGVVIARAARYLPDVAAARTVIGGYVLSNDLSEREYQLERGDQWDKGKSCETFNPIGPYLVTPDEVPDPQQLRLWLDVNGRRMQDSTTANMVFSVDHLVWYLSQFMVLELGDLINTGTPAGVGIGRTPERYLRPGHTMTLGGEHLGTSTPHVCRRRSTVRQCNHTSYSTTGRSVSATGSAAARQPFSGPLFPPTRRVGSLVFVSGQASVDEHGTIIPGTFAEEMHRSIDNVRQARATQGMSLTDVVKVNAYMHTPAELPEYNQLYRQYFAEPRPARTTLTNCLTHTIKFEIDVIAYAPEQDGARR